MSLDWDAVIAFGLALPGVELSTSYGKPALKANGRTFVSPGREDGSFCLHIGKDEIEMLRQTDPETFWQTPHYEGWAAVLVRYDTHDPDRVLELIARARDEAASRRPPRPRGKS